MQKLIILMNSPSSSLSPLHHLAQSTDWKLQLKEAARTPQDFVKWGLISDQKAQQLSQVHQKYNTLVSAYYLSLIDMNDPACPIRKQAIPSIEELTHHAQESLDPIGDHTHQVTPILVHRYPDRALLFPTYRCPMFCRYCFRKETLNGPSFHFQSAFKESLNYLKKHPQIEEVILSGGDPLMFSTSRLDTLLRHLKEVGIQRLRIHSRFPVTLPQRITDHLAQTLGQYQPLTLITHFNHPKEVSPQAKLAVQKLRQYGVQLLNQSVLLAGVNDCAETLLHLSKLLLNQSIRPYYLHHPDQTTGTQHFRVSLRKGLEINRILRGRLSGFGLPLYVLDIPNGRGKVPVDSHWVQPTSSPQLWKVTSPLDSQVYLYEDLGESDIHIKDANQHINLKLPPLTSLHQT